MFNLMRSVVLPYFVVERSDHDKPPVEKLIDTVVHCVVVGLHFLSSCLVALRNILNCLVVLIRNQAASSLYNLGNILGF